MKNEKIISKMKTRGGSFVQRLALLMEVADAENYERLIKAFPEIWEIYGGKNNYDKK